MDGINDEMSLNSQLSDGGMCVKQWYVLYTVPGKESEAAELLERAVSHNFWICCGIPKKIKVFRSGGILHLLEDVMFPGYLFVQTEHPEELAKELGKARQFPQLIGSDSKSGKDLFTPVEEKDLRFLQDVCGERLQRTMGVTKIVLNEENRIVLADGVLDHYRDRIVKLNLHKRFAIVEIELFNRRQEVLFGVRLEQDRAG